MDTPAGVVASEADLACLAGALAGGPRVLSGAERRALAMAGRRAPPPSLVSRVRREILRGGDPLGDTFVAMRTPERRRRDGAVYTPDPIARPMVLWLGGHGPPARIVDCGAGSGRFALLAADAFPRAQVVAVEKDPLAALVLRANLAVRGLRRRVTVLVEDFRAIDLPRIRGRTAFVGNPPYVRHHDIGEQWKRWYTEGFASLGLRASALAGLHLHFFLKIRMLAEAGDVDALITAAEWMDVNYGSALRALLSDQLGLEALHVLDPAVQAFPGTATTAAISCFRVGSRGRLVKTREVLSAADLNGLARGTPIPRAALRQGQKWSGVTRGPRDDFPGRIALGDIFRVHRGQVTGNNAVWVAGEHATGLPDPVMFSAVTRARDLISAGGRLVSADRLRKVVDLPPDLGTFGDRDRRRILEFLRWARAQGAHTSYIARHRRPWWSVGLRTPAPILCTYMARRPPQFTLNLCGARHINIAHGLYPMVPLAPETLAALVDWLNRHVHVADGRTYAGGLTKFEPGEVERIRIPRLEDLPR